jgi:hypothetical protein
MQALGEWYMKTGKVYVGDINVIRDDVSYLYDEFCPLMEIKDGFYVNLDWINTPLDYFKLYRVLLTGKIDKEIVLSDREEGVYVSKESLVSLYDPSSEKEISIVEMKKHLSVDPRLRAGFEEDECGFTEYERKPNPNKKH